MKISNALLMIFALSGTVGASAQQLIISVDGRNNVSVDTTLIISREYSFLNARPPGAQLSVYPGKINTYSVNMPGPALIGVGNAEVLVGKDDSISLIFDPKEKNYIVTGGRYPGNYIIYNKLKDARIDYSRYNKSQDNYPTFAGYLDSLSYGQAAELEQDRKKTALSDDVYDFMRAYIRVVHISALLRTKSATLIKNLPQTSSKFVPIISTEDFNETRYPGMMNYTVAALQYVRLVAYNRPATPDTGFHSLRSKHLYSALSFAIDSLRQETQKLVLYNLIENNDWSEEVDDKASFVLIFDKIHALKLPGLYSRAIERQQSKALLDGNTLDPAISTSTLLTSMDNKHLTLQTLINAYKGKNVIIELWSPDNNMTAVRVSEGSNIQNKYDEENYSILHIGVDKRGREDWAEYCKAANKTNDQFYLENGTKSPLIGYFKISNLPTYIAIGRSMEIQNSDIPLYKMTSFALMNTTIDH